jgi:hypothetical protein
MDPGLEMQIEYDLLRFSEADAQISIDSEFKGLPNRGLFSDHCAREDIYIYASLKQEQMTA